jgi:hypothetical protein
MLDSEYHAALERLARIRDEDPQRFSNVLFHLGLPVASWVLDELAQPAPAEAR